MEESILVTKSDSPCKDAILKPQAKFLFLGVSLTKMLTAAISTVWLILLCSEWPKHHRVLAILGATGVSKDREFGLTLIEKSHRKLSKYLLKAISF